MAAGPALPVPLTHSNGSHKAPALWLDSQTTAHRCPLLRTLAEQPAIWGLPLAIALMVIISRMTRATVPADVRAKMLVLHAPESLGLKQEYLKEHEGLGH